MSQNFLWPSVTYCVYQVVSWGRGCLWHSFTSVQQHQSAVTVPCLQTKSCHIWLQSLQTCIWLHRSSELSWQTLWGHTDIKHVSQIRHIMLCYVFETFSDLSLCFSAFLPVFELIPSAYKMLHSCVVFLFNINLVNAGCVFLWPTCTCFPARHTTKQWEDDWIRHIESRSTMCTWSYFAFPVTSCSFWLELGDNMPCIPPLLRSDEWNVQLALKKNDGE